MATKLSHQWNLFTIIRYGLALWVLFLSSTGKHLVPVHHHAYKSCCTITKVALTWHRDGCHSVVSQLLLGQQMPQLPRSRGQRIWERKTLVGYMYYLSEIQRNVNNKKKQWLTLKLPSSWHILRVYLYTCETKPHFFNLESGVLHVYLHIFGNVCRLAKATGVCSVNSWGSLRRTNKSREF